MAMTYLQGTPPVKTETICFFLEQELAPASKYTSKHMKPQSLCLNCILCRRVIHTVGPRYAVRYHTAAENALSHCYRSCLELLVEQGLQRYDHWMNLILLNPLSDIEN